MSKITIAQLAEIINADVIGPEDSVIESFDVSTDSRNILPRQIFFAIKGDKFDGHDFIDSAFNAGALCTVASKATGKITDKPLLKVKDTIKALGDLARWWRKENDFTVIAITGSAGKTTTRRMIAAALEKKYKVAQSPKSFNNHIGVPLTILSGEKDCDIIVAELGTNSHGEISNLSQIANPDIAVITNIYPAHLEGLGSIEGVIKEKASIIDGLKEDGILLVNNRFDDLKKYLLENECEFETFDTAKSKLGANTLEIDGIKVKIPLAGTANLENALAAWTVCNKFGISASQFASAVANLKTENMRLQILSFGEMTVINDCYNANPASMQNAIEYLKQLSSETGKRSVLLCGPMNELGTQSEKLHAELGENIAKSSVELLLAIGDWANIVADNAKRIAGDDIVTHTFKNTTELCNKLEKFVAHDDIVLVKGSRGAKLEAATAKLEQICLKVL